MMIAAVRVALLAVVTAALAAQPSDLKHDFDEAELRIARLPPSSFRELPPAVSRELLRRGCTIPQEAFTKAPHNVIKGSFEKPGQTDWAVLCSVRGVSTILVFWNGSGSKPAAIAPMQDRNFLQGINAHEIGYSRGIATAGKDIILQHYQAYGGPKPPPIDHQGIDDAFLGKASVAWYFHRGNWLQLSGAD